VQFVKYLVVMGVAAGLTACGSIDLSQIAKTIPQVISPTQVPEPAPIANSSSLARDMQSYRALVGQKIVQSNSGVTFSGKLPDPLAAIPVIEITLNADGSIRGLDVRRAPRFYPETSQTAMDAIRRAAPFGSVAHLPQPWIFNETFLFNDALKFQVLSLQP
jgi:hypothetical protein